MSQEKIDRLREVLAELGLTEGEGYEVYGQDLEVQFTVRLPEPERELPEELKPFVQSDYSVGRAIDKGNAEKRTMGGARYELALADYTNAIFRELPAVIALERSLKDVEDAEGFNAYEDGLQREWEAMSATNPRLRELQQDLEEHYY